MTDIQEYTEKDLYYICECNNIMDKRWILDMIPTNSLILTDNEKTMYDLNGDVPSIYNDMINDMVENIKNHFKYFKIKWSEDRVEYTKLDANEQLIINLRNNIEDLKNKDFEILKTQQDNLLTEIKDLRSISDMTIYKIIDLIDLINYISIDLSFNMNKTKIELQFEIDNIINHNSSNYTNALNQIDKLNQANENITQQIETQTSLNNTLEEKIKTLDAKIDAKIGELDGANKIEINKAINEMKEINKTFIEKYTNNITIQEQSILNIVNSVLTDQYNSIIESIQSSSEDELTKLKNDLFEYKDKTEYQIAQLYDEQIKVSEKQNKYETLLKLFDTQLTDFSSKLTDIDKNNNNNNNKIMEKIKTILIIIKKLNNNNNNNKNNTNNVLKEVNSELSKVLPFVVRGMPTVLLGKSGLQHGGTNDATNEVVPNESSDSGYLQLLKNSNEILEKILAGASARSKL